MEETIYKSQTGDGSNYRAYVVCEIGRNDSDNWLRTPFIQRRAAARMYIEMTFTMRDCAQYPGAARQCKETFALYAHEADEDYATEVKLGLSLTNLIVVCCRRGLLGRKMNGLVSIESPPIKVDIRAVRASPPPTHSMWKHVRCRLPNAACILRCAIKAHARAY
jgi:hypothetical protein